MWQMTVQFPEGNKVLVSSRFHNKVLSLKTSIPINLIDDYLLDAIIGMELFDNFKGVSIKDLKNEI